MSCQVNYHHLTQFTFKFEIVKKLLKRLSTTIAKQSLQIIAQMIDCKEISKSAI